MGLVITTGGIGGKERMGAGILTGGSNPNDMEVVEDDMPEERRNVEVIAGSCVCQAGSVGTDPYGPGRLRNCGAAAA